MTLKCPYLKTTHYEHNLNVDTLVATYEEFNDCAKEQCPFYDDSPRVGPVMLPCRLPELLGRVPR
jgi:hypothetical protein